MPTIRVLSGNCLPRFMATRPRPIIPLYGPPEIYRQNPTTTPSASSAAPLASPSASIIDTKAVTNSKKPSSDVITNLNMKTNFQQPPMWPTFRSTGNPCLDFFFHVVPNMSHRKVIQLLEISWAHDPLKTLKLVCNLRGVRGRGKFDKESYYAAALWLHNHHPKTLASNVASLAQFGYLKDLPEILFRLLEGSKSRKLAKETCHNKLKALRKKYSYFPPSESDTDLNLSQSDLDLERELVNDKIYRKYFEVEKIEKVKKVTLFKEKFSANIPLLNRDEKKIEMAKKVMERFNNDPKFKILHDRISGLFADCLRSDMNLLIGNEDCNINISLAAKWCPSLDSSYDKYTLLCEAIAKKVFPREEYEEYVGMEEGHYVYRVRDRLRKQVLVPLRKALELPEVYIGANDLGSLPYNRVASVAMRLYKDKFNKHDGERFKEYRRKVEEEKAKIALLPHEIIASLNDEDGGQVAELEWKRMVDDMLKNGKLSNCIAICDFSSYYLKGIQKDVYVALGILVSELSAGLSAEPWKGKLISFSKYPVLYRVEGETLKEKTESIIKVNDMKARSNIDFSKVYDLILNEAVNGRLKGDEMIKRIFVFSGTCLDETSSEARKTYAPEPWEASYEAIVSKYRERGYGNSVPEMVFWNLNKSKATIVPTKTLPGNLPGISLVDGFSKNLMKLFLVEGGDMNPEKVMDAAISGEEYKNLVVVD